MVATGTLSAPRRRTQVAKGRVCKTLIQQFESARRLLTSPNKMAASRDSQETHLTVVAGLGLVAPPPIHIQTATFEGSLATLLRCVRDNKVHLLDVPLLPVCEAYFDYLVQTQLADLDEAAAALLALSYLLERKAWALLPNDEPEPEPEEPLELPEPTVAEFG